MLELIKVLRVDLLKHVTLDEAKSRIHSYRSIRFHRFSDSVLELLLDLKALSAFFNRTCRLLYFVFGWQDFRFLEGFFVLSSDAL